MMIGEYKVVSDADIQKMVDDATINTEQQKLERLRDEFAMAAIQGMCAHPDTWGKGGQGIAREAYVIADAALKAREQSK